MSRDAVIVRPLGEADHDALLALSRATHTGSDRFRVERGPDFFAWPKYVGESTYLGVIQRDRLVGCVGLTSQRRYLKGRPTEVRYLHDLRTDPVAADRLTARRLTRALSHEIGAGWIFGTVLDENPFAERMVRVATRTLGKAHRLGQTAHVGWALFGRKPSSPLRVEVVSEETWEEHYLAWARGHDFAPADAQVWRAVKGPYLAAYEGSQRVAVTKLGGQSHLRQLIRTEGMGLAEKVVRWISSRRGGAPLPRPEEELRVGYLHCYASIRPGCRADEAFVAYAADHHRGDYTYVFRGLPIAEAEGRTFPVTQVKLSSTTWAIGALPESLTLGAHELALI